MDGLLPWFSETAETFAKNAEGAWSYDARVAFAQRGKIIVSNVSDDTLIDDELHYRPTRPAEKNFLVGEMQVSFDSVGSSEYDTKGGYLGIQLVDGPVGEDCRFALHDPMKGSSAWVVTGVSGKLETDYVVRYEIGSLAGYSGKSIRYSVRTVGEDSFRELGTMRMPADFTGINELSYSGQGTITSVEFGQKDGDEKSLALDISNISIDYGTDFTNATVTISVTNFWRGSEFKGGAYAHFFVYNAQGKLVDSIGAGGAEILSDGTFVIGSVNLRDGQSGEYRFEVKIVTEDGAGSIDDVVASSVRDEPGMRLDGSWFREDAETFAAGGQTGTWSVPGKSAVVSESSIVINTSETGGKVSFTPSEDVADDIVKVETEAVFDGVMTINGIPEPSAVSGRLAGLTIAELTDRDEIVWAGWVCDETLEGGGSFVPLYGNPVPSPGDRHVVSWIVNYTRGLVSYTVDGDALTNANGVSAFAIPLADRKGKSVKFFGEGCLTQLVGNRYNGNLAAVVDANGVTNQFLSVDEAVAAATNGGDRVVLLWDSTWRPSAADVGRTISFDTDGHDFIIDAAATNRIASEGYQLVDNGDGTYTISVTDYYLTFDANGGDAGSMPRQVYSVTNMIFNLASNRFEREGCTFDHWSDVLEGTNETSWADGATIDMTSYGLTNMTLYAQWRLATRLITVEAADEFVYIESVLTNGVVNEGTRYFQDDAGKATGKAIIPVTHGSDLIIRFSTDIEKRLTFDYLKTKSAVLSDGTLPYDTLPKIYVEGESPLLDPIQYWAVTRGISLMALKKSAYAGVSFRLNTDSLLNEASVVEITNFKTLPDGGCSFKVTVDGTPLDDVGKIDGVVRVSEDLSAEDASWRTIDRSKLEVDVDGTVMVKSVGPGMFMKIVIPRDAEVQN